MGLCQSRAIDFGVTVHGSDAFLHKPRPKNVSAPSTRHSMFAMRSLKASSLISPSENSTVTAPETPSYNFASTDRPRRYDSRFDDGLPHELSPEHYDSADKNENQSTIVPVMESVIIGEESHDAPSDEDDDILSMSARLDTNNPSSHPQESNRIITPDSTFRPAPLIAPPKKSNDDIPSTIFRPNKTPKASVNPQTIAIFNRLKIQVELAKQDEMNRRRKAKLKDRVEDVKGYRGLWKDFERMKQDAEGTIRNRSYGDGKNVKSLDLKETTTWYFDFRSLHVSESLARNDNVDNSSQTNMSLLSEVTMETQRKYFDEKLRERLKSRSAHQKQDSKEGVKEPSKSRRSVSDGKSHASAHSTMSTGRTLFLHASGEDYGPAKEGEISEVDTACDLGSDDSTPRTRTGREMARTTSSYHEGASVISDLDLDVESDYGVRCKRRTRRKKFDDSSMDTFDDGSIKPGFSNVEFDMTNFVPRIRDYGEPKKPNLTCESTGINRVPETTQAYTTQLSSTPRSRIDLYGFDPSAPLSSQLELFEEAPKCEDRRADCARVKEFCIIDKKRPIGAFRHKGFSVKEDGKEEVELAIPESIQSSLVNKGDCLQVDTSLSVAQEHDLGCMQNETQNHAARQLHPRTGSFQNFSPYEIMSPSQFMMMSSFHTSSCTSNDGEDSSGDKNEIILKKQEVKEPKGRTYLGTDEAKPSGECTSRSCAKSPVLKLYDPKISNLSTEAFLLMSSWHSRALSLENELPLMDLKDEQD